MSRSEIKIPLDCPLKSNLKLLDPSALLDHNVNFPLLLHPHHRLLLAAGGGTAAAPCRLSPPPSRLLGPLKAPSTLECKWTIALRRLFGIRHFNVFLKFLNKIRNVDPQERHNVSWTTPTTLDHRNDKYHHFHSYAYAPGVADWSEGWAWKCL